MTKTQHKLSVLFQITVNRDLLEAKLLYDKVEPNLTDTTSDLIM